MTEELKHFVEEYFKIYTWDDECPLYIKYITDDDYFIDENNASLETLSIFDKDKYLNVVLENEYTEIIQYFKDNYETIIKDIQNKEVQPFDIMMLSDGKYCGWVVKRDKPTEITYVHNGWL